MSAPTNITKATAINLGTVFPTTLTQDANSGGITNPLWYYIIPQRSGMISIFAFGNLTGYTAQLIAYYADGTTPPSTGGAYNVPFQLYGLAGTKYYFKISLFPPVPTLVTPAV